MTISELLGIRPLSGLMTKVLLGYDSNGKISKISASPRRLCSNAGMPTFVEHQSQNSATVWLPQSDVGCKLSILACVAKG